LSKDEYNIKKYTELCISFVVIFALIKPVFMKPKFKAQAGTFESSDILILIEPTETDSERIIELDSSVKFQFGNDIRKEIEKQLDKYEIHGVRLIAKDKGALSATIAARVETAIKRSLNIQEGTEFSNE